jgi:Fe-S cluster biogenesis protein NfuA
MNEIINKILEEKVNPVLSEHFGGAQLVGLENNVAKIRMTGACASCPGAQMTIQNVVREIIMENCDSVVDVILDTSVSDELYQEAKSFLDKNNK